MGFPTNPCLCSYQLTLYQQELAWPGVSLSFWVLGKFSRPDTKSDTLPFDPTPLKGDGDDAVVMFIHSLIIFSLTWGVCVWGGPVPVFLASSFPCAEWLNPFLSPTTGRTDPLGF